MSIESKVFSVKQRILHVMQNSALERSDWTLAQYFLLRYNDLGSIRITEQTVLNKEKWRTTAAGCIRSLQRATIV